MAVPMSMNRLLPVSELSVTKRGDIYMFETSTHSMVLETREMSNGRGRFCMSELDINMGGNLVNIVHHNDSMRHTFSITNNIDQRILKLRGPYCLSGNCTFTVFLCNNSKMALATIKRRGIFFRHEHNYNIKFEPYLNGTLKAAVIGAFVLIDTMIDGKICF